MLRLVFFKHSLQTKVNTDVALLVMELCFFLAFLFNNYYFIAYSFLAFALCFPLKYYGCLRLAPSCLPLNQGRLSATVVLYSLWDCGRPYPIFYKLLFLIFFLSTISLGLGFSPPALCIVLVRKHRVYLSMLVYASPVYIYVECNQK